MSRREPRSPAIPPEHWVARRTRARSGSRARRPGLRRCPQSDLQTSRPRPTFTQRLRVRRSELRGQRGAGARVEHPHGAPLRRHSDRRVRARLRAHRRGLVPVERPRAARADQDLAPLPLRSPRVTGLLGSGVHLLHRPDRYRLRDRDRGGLLHLPRTDRRARSVPASRREPGRLSAVHQPRAGTSTACCPRSAAGRELFWIRTHQLVSYLVIAVRGEFSAPQRSGDQSSPPSARG